MIATHSQNEREVDRRRPLRNRARRAAATEPGGRRVACGFGRA